ncbi:MAG: hypothetical protein FJ091_22260, partial [Deltaproteobacteria bacterium]|nr:hypothetical protein [Deltaproteobacteria bacterium]
RARVRPEALEALPVEPRLLGSGTKTEKGEGRGYLTAVVYMAPAREAFSAGDRRTLCAFASSSCEGVCLGRESGRMVFHSARLSRLWKAALYMGARHLWRELLEAEIRAFERAAARVGLKPAVRIDGSSDIGEGPRFAQAFSGVQFYDYTKNPARALQNARGERTNYHLTFSYSGRNAVDAERVLASGGNVAVVFGTARGVALPETWSGHPTLDADQTDLRFLDPRGHVAALRFKAARAPRAALAAAIASGFVIAVD